MTRFSQVRTHNARRHAALDKLRQRVVRQALLVPKSVPWFTSGTALLGPRSPRVDADASLPGTSRSTPCRRRPRRPGRSPAPRSAAPSPRDLAFDSWSWPAGQLRRTHLAGPVRPRATRGGSPREPGSTGSMRALVDRRLLPTPDLEDLSDGHFSGQPDRLVAAHLDNPFVCHAPYLPTFRYSATLTPDRPRSPGLSAARSRPSVEAGLDRNLFHVREFFRCSCFRISPMTWCEWCARVRWCLSPSAAIVTYRN